MEFYPQLDGYVLVAVTWDNCDMGPTQYSVIEDRAAELGDSATVRRYKLSAYGDEHLALYAREHVRCTVPDLSYCPGCGEIVQGSDPCACVFDVRGTLDAQGLLHTAKRVDLGPLAAV